VKFILGIFWCFMVTSSMAQLFEHQVWVETGVKYNLNKTNLQFSHTYKRFDLGLRIRYQYSFDRLGGSYDSEFDQAWRIKPGAEYNIKGLPITPSLSAEFFYNPENSANGKQFNRIRYYAGTTIELKHNQGIELGLFYDQWINGIPRKRLMYSFSYVISLGSAKKENKKPSKNLRDL